MRALLRGFREARNRRIYFYYIVKLFSGNKGTPDQIVGIKGTLIYFQL